MKLMKQRYSNLKLGNSFLKNYIHLISKWMKGVYENLLEKNALSIFKKLVKMILEPLRK